MVRSHTFSAEISDRDNCEMSVSSFPNQTMWNNKRSPIKVKLREQNVAKDDNQLLDCLIAIETGLWSFPCQITRNQHKLIRQG